MSLLFDRAKSSALEGGVVIRTLPSECCLPLPRSRPGAGGEGRGENGADLQVAEAQTLGIWSGGMQKSIRGLVKER